MTNTATSLHPTVEEFLLKFGLIYKVFECDPDFADTAQFCEKYGFSEGHSANTIVVAGKADPLKLCACVILATTKVDVNRKVCKLLSVKKGSFASGDQTKELTGMQIGGVTPFGLPDIPIYVDAAVMNVSEAILGGGNRSTKVLLDPKELLKIPHVEVIDGLAVAKG
ncbi:MAG TPA: YbaK/EbsC family protein [Drouetiella sp.]|jgi:prolyl-tRNA editing enzyme YbaK/EbsC (Cys-tRNA(Pro) deacylase)